MEQLTTFFALIGIIVVVIYAQKMIRKMWQDNRNYTVFVGLTFVFLFSVLFLVADHVEPIVAVCWLVFGALTCYLPAKLIANKFFPPRE
jgi:hypothetical protein